ncbi:MAG: hypothetical protein A3F46_05085 [Legionellales bacterium RIFCSPHIGHO2_12_FULL_42_9]|nr:MAG: hypothetical protein A3F46_05085 [Legionellales bacterium RIFCSPHIGHO2_12_FULL_42_9]
MHLVGVVITTEVAITMEITTMGVVIMVAVVIITAVVIMVVAGEALGLLSEYLLDQPSILHAPLCVNATPMESASCIRCVTKLKLTGAYLLMAQKKIEYLSPLDHWLFP